MSAVFIRLLAEEYKAAALERAIQSVRPAKRGLPTSDDFRRASIARQLPAKGLVR